MKALISDCIISLNQATPEPPVIFAFPGAGQKSDVFHHFAKEAGSSYSVFGVEPRGLRPGERPFVSVEEASEAYADMLFSKASNRAVHLIGHLFGGLVAFETALRLQARGMSIVSLGLLNPPLPQWRAETSLVQIQRSFLSNLYDPRTFTRPAVAIEAAEKTTTEFIASLKRLLPARASEDFLFAQFETFRAAFQANYSAKGPFNGTGHIFIAFGKDENQIIPQWERMLRNMTICLVPVGSHQMLQPQNSHSLFRMWRESLRTSELQSDH